MKEFFKIPRLYVDRPLETKATISLTKPQSHYLKNVLRFSANSPIRVFNGQNGEFLANIQNMGKLVDIGINDQIRPQTTEKGPWLFFSPIKKNRMDFLVEKSVELSVGHLCPILTQRTIVRSMNMEKTQTHIIEAAEQSERLTLPTLSPLAPLLKIFDNLPKDQILYFCQERGENTPLLSSLKITTPPAILIGPEGGFTSEEIAILTSHPQVKPVSLGNNILRAETAALCALSQVGETFK